MPFDFTAIIADAVATSNSPAALLAALGFTDCAGVDHVQGAAIPSCVDLTNAMASTLSNANAHSDAGDAATLTAANAAMLSTIAAAIAALPADNYLSSLASYTAATHTMVLTMAGGSTV